MGFHHVALATTDLAATHALYTEADRTRAWAVLTEDAPELESAPEPVFHRGRRPSADAPAPAAGG